MLAILILGIIGILCLMGPATLREPYDDPATAEGWAWAQIKADNIADLNKRCDPTGKLRLDPNTDVGWDNPCRQISAHFIAEILTDPRWRDQIRRHGLRLRGAHIYGVEDSEGHREVDLINADVGAEVLIDGSRINGSLNLTGAHLARRLTIERTRIGGDVLAERLVADSDLALHDGSVVTGLVKMSRARIAGQVDLSRSTFEKALDGASMTVGGDLSLQGCVNRYGKLVGRDCTTFEDEVKLHGVDVGGQLDLDGATFVKRVSTEDATIRSDFFARNAKFGADAYFIFTHSGGDLDLRGSIVNRVNLTSAVVAQDLRLGGDDGASDGDVPAPQPALQWECVGLAEPCVGCNNEHCTSWPLGTPPRWNARRCSDEHAPKLILRNTHVNTLQDCPEAWPPCLELEGFKYDRLGGFGAEAAKPQCNGGRSADPRTRSTEEWQDWLERDPTYSPQPYTQLAGVLLAAGNRDAAETIQYAGRERERHGATGLRWLLLTFLWGIGGYGIGLHTFVVFLWAALFSWMGAIILRSSHGGRAQKKDWLWCFGASLQRLLPVIPLNKEFASFFDNPSNLSGGQATFFSWFALVGWVLGFFLLAAFSGLTQKG